MFYCFCFKINIFATACARIPCAIMKRSTATQANFETRPFRLHLLKEGPSTKTVLSRDDALKYYTQLATIRKMELSAGNLYRNKIIRGFCHLYSGQEAVAVGITSALRPHDAAITSYRAHAWTYLMGSTMLEVFSELTGRQSGCARGKGGSMHMYTNKFYGGNGIVGAQVPIGVGVAFAFKYNNTDRVCITLYGDGAANQGQIYEVYNIAKLLNIPVVFVCENNGYGMGTSVKRASASTDYFARVDYIPGISADGMDVLAVREAAKFVVNYCASGKGPIILEVITYRYSGHSMSDPGTSYRSQDEVQQVRKKRDPIIKFKEKIISSNLVTEEELSTIVENIKKEVADVAQKAVHDKEIGLEELTCDIYSTNLEKEIRNVDPDHPLTHKRLGPAVNV